MATRNVSDPRELLRAGRWFRDLPASFQDALVSMASLRKVGTGEVLFSRGQPFDAMYAVLKGRLRAVGLDVDGREALLAVLAPPSWVGEIPLFDGLPRTHDLIAEVPSVVACVPAQPLLAHLEAEPRHWRDLGALLTHKLRLAFTAIEDGILLSTRQKIARRLLLIAEGYGQWTDRSYPLVEVSQEVLATMVSSSRQTVNAELRKLEEEGLVEQAYGSVKIRDFDELRKVAQATTQEIQLKPRR
jgi:CRP/FNR family transcriptional regulator, cyclic AMP receptor protein